MLAYSNVNCRTHKEQQALTATLSRCMTKCKALFSKASGPDAADAAAASPAALAIELHDKIGLD